MHITPLYDKIVVRRDPLLTVTPEGIQLPANSQKPLNTGTVLVVGEGRLCPALPRHNQMIAAQMFAAGNVGECQLVKCHVEPLRVKVGDRVMFGDYGGNEIEFDVPGQKEKDKVLLISEDEILCVFTAPNEKESTSE